MTSVNDPNLPPSPGMAQCQVTGQWLPEDELVTIHGTRVGAEGKQILLERLQSGEAMPGQLEVQSVWRRWGAMWVDGLVFMAAYCVVGIPVFIVLTVTGLVAMRAPPKLLFALLGVVVQLALFGYYAVMHGALGQTVGKMAVRIKVVNPDGSRITMNQAAMRALYYCAPFIVWQLANVTLLRPVVIVAAFPVLGYALADLICALVDPRQRSLHDRLAKTRVVRV